MMILKAAFISVLSSVCAVGVAGQTADLVVRNANVHTVSETKPTAASIAVIGNKIVAVGADSDTKSWIGPSTRVIDAKGKVVVPGFRPRILSR